MTAFLVAATHTFAMTFAGAAIASLSILGLV